MFMVCSLVLHTCGWACHLLIWLLEVMFPNFSWSCRKMTVCKITVQNPNWIVAHLPLALHVTESGTAAPMQLSQWGRLLFAAKNTWCVVKLVMTGDVLHQECSVWVFQVKHGNMFLWTRRAGLLQRELIWSLAVCCWPWRTKSGQCSM